jgi:hypothetical protein
VSPFIVLAHDLEEFAAPLADLLRGLGYRVVWHVHPLAAWDDVAKHGAQLLITRVEFRPGVGNGIALACRARMAGVKVLFVALAQYAEDCAALGLHLPYPCAVGEVLEAVHRLLSDVAADLTL